MRQSDDDLARQGREDIRDCFNCAIEETFQKDDPPSGDAAERLRQREPQQAAKGNGKGARDDIPKTGRGARSKLTTDDFWCHMPTHKFIYTENGDLWPSSSVNNRVPPVFVGYDADGKEVYIPAASWIAEHQPVEAMTWHPGLPRLILDKLMTEGGLIDKPGATLFNLYRPAPILLGDPSKAGPWLDHIRLVFPDDVEHFVKWFAHRVQRPHEKINHALVMIGEQGVGKDTILCPVIDAIGRWNHKAISPTVLLGRFNGWAKTVILQVNEGRDLGEVNRYAFYEHCKPLLAAPPDRLFIDEKNRPEYLIPNLCGVVIGSNYKTDGIYLPEDDRRHYVAASEAARTDFKEGYFEDLYRWFDKEGSGHVAAYLRSVDLSDFNAKKPPPKTTAFWEIVTTELNPEVALLKETTEEMGKPPVVTIAMIIAKAGIQNADLETWLRDPKNRRQIPKNMDRAGYAKLANPNAEDGFWVIGGKRTVVYGRKDIPYQGRLSAVKELQS
ncbi:primase-helicase family protein [Sinorhizobium meliloti]